MNATVGRQPGGEAERVLYVTPETADFVKAGGLGDVAAALPRALRRRCDVRVLLPAYRQVVQSGHPIETIGRLPGSGAIPACDLGRIAMPDGLTVYVLLAPGLYDREGSPYGDVQGRDWPDNDIRFARLSLAAAQMAGGEGDRAWTPEFLHLNDWPTALAAGYLNWNRTRTPSLLTIHNLAYQGLFEPSDLSRLSIPQSAFGIDGVEFHGKLSFLKAGIFYANHVTTVSATYAEEITRPELGCGLDGLLRLRAEEGRLTGILNGIEDAGSEGAGDKAGEARRVRREFGLSASDGPLFAIVSRLVHQKGLDLVIEAAEDIVARGGQLAVTGRGEKRFEDAMQRLGERHRGEVGVRIGFDQQEANAMYAGSDFLLMPSRFEPCGLSQMYAQRAGSLPIAHRTGGLADTIEDGHSGFLFREFSVPGLTGAIRRALATFAVPERLAAMRRFAMTRPFGWAESAARYRALYQTGGA